MGLIICFSSIAAYLLFKSSYILESENYFYFSAYQAFNARIKCYVESKETHVH